MLLKNKVIVIFGGEGLLGKVFVDSINENGGTSIIADIKNSSNTNSYVVDCLSSESLENFISDVKKDFGKVDAIVNCSYPKNKNYGRKLPKVDFDDFIENNRDHLGAFFLPVKKFINFFLEQGYGNVVSISSIYGTTAPKFSLYENTDMTVPVEYITSKAAINQLTKYLAKFYKGKKIRFNSISPGGIFDHQPSSFIERYSAECIDKGMLDPEDIAGTLIFLLSDLSRYINGQNIIVDDGFSL